ncbi:MAG: hypothetical protein M3Q45_11945 [Chloroflexota bacterium]|nr:hypothetical protein [Chloroflexota bacterium]
MQSTFVRVLIFSLLVMGLMLGLVSCTQSKPSSRPPALSLPQPVTTAGPPLPFQEPNILAEPGAGSRPIVNNEQLQSCLAGGEIVYGITLQNTNVRAAPKTDACRVGRIPRGSLVRITGSASANSDLILVPTATPLSRQIAAKPVNSATAQTIGYVEDIQPIFNRSCNSCHSAVVKNAGLQVTAYAPLLAGSQKGAVVIPGDADASLLWQQVGTGKMPLIGQLPDDEKTLIRDWIELGAPEKRAVVALEEPAVVEAATNSSSPRLWLAVDDAAINPVQDVCKAGVETPQTLISSELLLPISCGIAPRAAELTAYYKLYSIPLPTPPAIAKVVQSARIPISNTAATSATAQIAEAPVSIPSAYASGAGSAAVGLQAAALNLPPPSDNDPWLTPNGGFCVEERLANKLDRGVTALAFAPDGTLFMALDAPLGESADPLILYDAYHPSRSVAVYNTTNDSGFAEIFKESSRITGMTYANGALYLNRAGEVGRIVDGGGYERLAIGFAVNSQLFHANNGIAITGGWLYVGAGGVIDGYSEGPIVGIPEAAAISIVGGGNRFAARLVRAPLDALLGQRSIELFQTAARGLRNPYGLTTDPGGRLWLTDNGATNVADAVSAGDEVNLFDPNVIPPGLAEEATPFYGFPLALGGTPPDWYTQPVLALPNTSAPTSITWAYGTIFYGQYGRDPGLYRLGRAADGSLVSERIMLVWPLLATTTAPDGALWVGTGDGGLFRLTPGCG